MIGIGLISDTHGYLDGRILDWFSSVDEIWHAGDIGSIQVFEELKAFKPLRAVYGNIDGKEIRSATVEDRIFECEGICVWITHIGGYPGRYERRVTNRLQEIRPGLLVCGHSHILKVMHDKKHQLLYLNPGAAGKFGIHKYRTALRFNILNNEITDLEVLELSQEK